MKGKVLVTGGTGFIGSYICRYLLQSGYLPVVLKRPDSPLNLLQGVVEKLEFVDGDLGDLMLLDTIIKDVDYIIHCAAMLSFNASDRNEMMHVNVGGTSNLVNSALLHPVKKFVHISSVAAFGKTIKHRIVDEQTPWISGPDNTLYGISKFRAEKEVYRGHAEGLNVAILCPSLVIGAGTWNKGTASIVDRVAKGNRFYLDGMNGIVDVRDVAILACKSLTLESSIEKIIVSGSNMSSRLFLEALADEFGAIKPTIRIGKTLGWMACIYDYLLSIIRGSNRLITLESLKSGRSKTEYINSKSRKLMGHEYIPFEKSIQGIVASYQRSIMNHQDFGTLSFQ